MKLIDKFAWWLWKKFNIAIGAVVVDFQNVQNTTTAQLEAMVVSRNMWLAMYESHDAELKLTIDEHKQLITKYISLKKENNKAHAELDDIKKTLERLKFHYKNGSGFRNIPNEIGFAMVPIDYDTTLCRHMYGQESEKIEAIDNDVERLKTAVDMFYKNPDELRGFIDQMIKSGFIIPQLGRDDFEGAAYELYLIVNMRAMYVEPDADEITQPV